MHELTIDILRWGRANNVTQQGQTELFGLLKSYFDPHGADNHEFAFPTTHRKATTQCGVFYDTLPIHHVELCMCGCHRWPQDAMLNKHTTCPECGKLARDSKGQRTTCTFTKFDLRDKLRLLYARPNLVGLLTAHETHIAESQAMRDIFGTYQDTYTLNALCIFNVFNVLFMLRKPAIQHTHIMQHTTQELNLYSESTLNLWFSLRCMSLYSESTLNQWSFLTLHSRLLYA